MVQKPKKLLNTHEDLEVYLECRGEDRSDLGLSFCGTLSSRPKPSRLARRDETPASRKQHFDTFRQAQCKGSM